MADRMAIMHKGGVRQVGSPRDLYARPSSRFVADFVGEINLLPGEVSAVGDVACVETGLGATRCRTGYDGIEKGDRVSLAVRPEALSLLDDEPTDVENTFAGTVRSVTYLGDLEQYVVELEDGTRVKVVEHNPLDQKAGPGDRVTIGFDPGSAVILKDEGETTC